MVFRNFRQKYKLAPSKIKKIKFNFKTGLFLRKTLKRRLYFPDS
ncbi:hypothetical protein ZPR_2859 [Zunongwangia profunda SM-A87]|uniref:Uncharacterized protein n=1 Tax=Zunongwangia profunda (strain DSM 18752 / CCTCC AB 206139 / SM-A87) TaxID=655815 RepID=D5BG66_ZUNPS|nr:hypothetical protein ZPR_2859 [Zunongwangia profunda SM-A87]